MTLADFYSRLTGWPVVYTSREWVSIAADTASSFHLSFQRAPGHVAPAWPDPESSMQMHLHVRVVDLDAAQAQAVALGATVFDNQPNPSGSRVLTDPAGHPFCLVG
jgi:predicted enzyme related to lactoylglutathione lyase